MTVLLAALILILFSLVIDLHHHLSGTRLPRVLAAAVLGISWLLVGLGRLDPNQILLSLSWGGELPDLVVALDFRGWAFSQAAVTIALVQSVQNTWSASRLAGAVRLSGVTLLAGLAGSVFTLLLVWVILDLLWYSSNLANSNWSVARSPTYLPALIFAAGPLILLLLSLFLAGNQGTWSSFPGRYSTALIAAGVFRLGIFDPSHHLFTDRLPSSWKTWTARLSPRVMALLLIARGADTGGELSLPGLIPGLAVGLILIALLAFLSPGKKKLPSFWTLGLIGLAVISGLQSEGGHSQTWGTVLLLGGTLLVQQESPGRPSLVYQVGILLLFFGLPFTLLWGQLTSGAGDLTGWLTALAAGLLTGRAVLQARLDFQTQADFQSGADFQTEPADRAEMTFEPDPGQDRTAAAPLVHGAGPVDPAALLSGALLVLSAYWINGSSSWWRASLAFWKQPLQVWLIPFCSGVSFLGARYLTELPRVLANLPGAAADLGRISGRGVERLLQLTAVIHRRILGLLEGRGGLVWAFLGAFLMLTLLLGGG